ncbi:host-nuclease inhibitor Gam family protein [Aeribacillus sp. FSL W8-0870]|uniref:host-nuclease inhibitor Gam family protein n=1 Tax=Aeribacillus sp. FSL W8-0870 TaxID=2954706 RepID=UPI0030CF99A1
MNVLQEFELQELENQEELKQRFQITGIDSLNWAFRKLAAFKAKAAEVEQLAQAERERIDRWEEEQKKSIQQNIEFFEQLIHEYHAKVLQDDPKTKTLSTPYGKSKARKSKAQPEKANENLLLQHVKENGMTEFIKESVKWGDLKKTLKVVEVNGQQVVIDENGQVVPGVVVKPETISYSVEVE